MFILHYMAPGRRREEIGVLLYDVGRNSLIVNITTEWHGFDAAELDVASAFTEGLIAKAGELRAEVLIEYLQSTLKPPFFLNDARLTEELGCRLSSNRNLIENGHLVTPVDGQQQEPSTTSETLKIAVLECIRSGSDWSLMEVGYAAAGASLILLVFGVAITLLSIRPHPVRVTQQHEQSRLLNIPSSLTLVAAHAPPTFDSSPSMLNGRKSRNPKSSRHILLRRSFVPPPDPTTSEFLDEVQMPPDPEITVHAAEQASPVLTVALSFPPPPPDRPTGGGWFFQSFVRVIKVIKQAVAD